jgi:anti-sigma B factor antagonist
MALDVHQREREGIVIFDLKGRITLGQEATTLRDMVERLETQSRNQLILNMVHVDYVDSSGLGTLVMISSNLKKRGGAVKLLNLNRRNVELLVMTKLSTIFEIFGDEQDAINSFFPDRELKPFDLLNFVRQLKEEEG